MNEREAGVIAKMVDKQLAAAEKRIVAKAEAAVEAALQLHEKRVQRLEALPGEVAKTVAPLLKAAGVDAATVKRVLVEERSHG